MDTWDSRFPPTAAETTLFAQLHAKATKFPAPANIKTRLNDDGNEVEKVISETVTEEPEDSELTQ